MKAAYYIKDTLTNTYCDTYAGDIFFTTLNEVRNCKYSTYEEAKQAIINNGDEGFLKQQLVIEEVFIRD